jgi:hypothetical protein
MQARACRARPPAWPLPAGSCRWRARWRAPRAAAPARAPASATSATRATAAACRCTSGPSVRAWCSKSRPAAASATAPGLRSRPVSITARARARGVGLARGRPGVERAASGSMTQPAQRLAPQPHNGAPCPAPPPAPGDRCGTCSGAALVSEKKTFEVAIEPGARHGQKIVLRGEAGISEPGLEPGDVVLVVSQREHPVFQRMRHNSQVGRRRGGRLCVCVWRRGAARAVSVWCACRRLPWRRACPAERANRLRARSRPPNTALPPFDPPTPTPRKRTW